jgi:predicted transcriptional regulator of viral defense system
MRTDVDVTTNNIVSHLLERGVYTLTPRALASLLQLSLPRAYYLVQKLKERGWIMEVEKGHYLVVGFEPYRVTTHPFFVAASLLIPSYVSFVTALNHYGLTEQVPFTVFIATPIKHNPILFGKYTFRYVRFKPPKFFGYSKHMEGDLPILMAEAEKALVDSLDLIRYRYGGGLQDLAKALLRGTDGGRFDPVKLVDYAIKMRNKSLCARLGYLAGMLAVLHPEIERLKEFLPKGFVPFDPARALTSQWDADWKVNVNVSRDELFDFVGGVR